VFPETGYTDPVVKIQFFVRLENSRLGYATFSGLAKYEEPQQVGTQYYLFYVLTDYASGRIGEALNRFLNEKVYPNVPKPNSGGALTGLTDDQTNVDIQLGSGLQAGTPLYLNAKITVVTFK
jgi:hypothetical protein